MSTTTPDPEFDDAALAEFRRVLGDAITNDFAAAFADGGYFVLASLCQSLELSQNDRKIFYGAARALQREEQPA